MNRNLRPAFAALLAVALLAAHLTPAAAFAPPVATGFSTTVSTVGASAIQLQGSDPDGTALTYATASTPSHGALSNLNASTGVVIYTPAAGYVGPDSFTFTVTSGGDTTAAATVSITVTNAKTRVIDKLLYPDGTPRQGKVTFSLTQQVTSPSGIVPLGSSVSAVLNQAGQFDLSVYPSRSLSPQSYYQVKFAPSNSVNTETLGLYDIPAAATAVTLAPYKVMNANLAASYTMPPLAAIEGLTAAAANATTQVLLGGTPTDQALQKYDAASGKFKDSGILDGATMMATKPLNVSAGISGSGSGLRNLAPSGAPAIVKVGSTNALEAATFQDRSRFGEYETGTGKVNIGLHQSPGRIHTEFGRTVARLTKTAPGDVAEFSYNGMAHVLNYEQYYAGGWAESPEGGATLTMTFGEVSNVLSSAASLPVSSGALPVTATTSSGLFQSLIGDYDDSAPRWSTTTYGATVRWLLTGAGTVNLMAAYLIREKQAPFSTATRTSPGNGVHEAIHDGTHAYLVNHSAGQVCKFTLPSAGFERVGCANTSAYGHDIVEDAGYLYVPTYTGAQLHRINKTTLVVQSYPLLGGRDGLGVVAHNGKIYVGAGSVSPAIIRFDPATAVEGTTTGQSVFSTAGSPADSNYPLVVAAGSLWTVDVAGGVITRVSLADGSTEANISGGIGTLYGLGAAGGKVYVSGVRGSVEINPSTNAVTYLRNSRRGWANYSNLKSDDQGRVFGVGQGGNTVFMWDPERPDQPLAETFTDAGSAKAVLPLPDGTVAVFYYNLPIVNFYKVRTASKLN